MRTNILAAFTVVGVASLINAADNAIVVGKGASDISVNTWKDISSSPTNSTTSKFTGFDVSKSYPGSEQDGWELGVHVKTNVKGSNGNITATVMSISPPNNGTFDSSWHFCVYAFTVKATSSYAYFAGQKDSCSNLVAAECVDDLKKNAVKNSATDGCKPYSTTPSCLRDLDEEQAAKVLSVSASNASDALSKNSTFYRRVDGDADAFKTAASQPMLVITVFGSSKQSDKAPTAEAACVQPNAKEKTSDASHLASLMGWAVAALSIGFQLAM